MSVFLVYAQQLQRIVNEQDKGAGSKKQFQPDPTTAALLSAAVPGAGQMYARAWWHAPIFVVAETYCLYRAWEFNEKADSLWSIRSTLDPESGEYATVGEEFSSAAENRNSFLWFFAAVKFLDIVDAYVSAHLYDFDEKSNPKVAMEFVPRTRSIKVALTVNFK